MTTSLPYYTSGEVIKGFGRGSKQLGIPTANYPRDVVQKLPRDINTGVYYGWAQVENSPIYKMVMSIGWNPFYKNKEKSMETYIIHKFDEDFYGQILKIVILGYIRPEMDFKTVEELKETIWSDIRQAEKELDRPEYEQQKKYFHKQKNILKYIIEAILLERNY